LAGDSYRGVICLIGPGERDEEDEETCNDSDGREEIFHKSVFLRELIFQRIQKKNGRIVSKRVVVCPAKNFDKRFFDDQTGNAARAGFFWECS